MNPLQSGNAYIEKGVLLTTASAGYNPLAYGNIAYKAAIGGSADSLAMETATTQRSIVGVALCEYSTTPTSLWWAWINPAGDL